jgi:hypothetical protein
MRAGTRKSSKTNAGPSSGMPHRYAMGPQTALLRMTIAFGEMVDVRKREVLPFALLRAGSAHWALVRGVGAGSARGPFDARCHAVKDEEIAVRIIEGFELCDFAEAEVGRDVGHRSLIELVPGGVPSGLVLDGLCFEVLGAEVVADGRHSCNERDVAAANTQQQMRM